jgi:hypothetical protein
MSTPKNHVTAPSTEEGRGERKQRECLCPLSLSIHHNLACDGYIESTCCCVQARFLGMETKILFSLLWYIQRYLKKYLKFEFIFK